MAEAGVSAPFQFRLFVVGLSPLSVRAISNARLLLDRYLADRYELEVADVSQRPQWVIEADLIALPTLVRLHPPPVRRLIGDLSRETPAMAEVFSCPPLPHQGVG